MNFSIFFKDGALCVYTYIYIYIHGGSSHLLLDVIYVPSVFSSNVVSWAPDS